MNIPTLLQSIILGLVQGLSEFLPISSSGHLVLTPALLRWPPPGLAFDTLLHWGTLLAVVSYFWRDLWLLARDWFVALFLCRPATPASRLAWLLIIGTLPAALIGFLGESFVEQLFVAPVWVGGFLLITALLLVISERLGKRERELDTLSVWDALLIGAAQGLAVAPGLSRSGATIAMALFLGLRRPAAARFSFLLSAPIIFGAGLLQTKDVSLAGAGWASLLAGFLAAAIAGYLCIRFLLAYLQRGKLYLFAGYCALVGAAAILLGALGWF